MRMAKSCTAFQTPLLWMNTYRQLCIFIVSSWRFFLNIFFTVVVRKAGALLLNEVGSLRFRCGQNLHDGKIYIGGVKLLPRMKRKRGGRTE
jgi:hypothetical protein